MTQIVLNIESKKKWDALKTVLEAMDIDYLAHDSAEKMSEAELELLSQAENDKKYGRVYTYSSHRDILGRQ